MVYCGKPSKGCSNCRGRKIRCDQKEPGCGQCEKRNQACPGYRNLVDLMFRDESSHVISKAAKTRSRASSSESRVRSRSRRKRAVASSSASVSASERPTPSPTPSNRLPPVSAASSGSAFALLKPPVLAGLTPRSGTTTSSSPSDRSFGSFDEAEVEAETDAEAVEVKAEPGSTSKDGVDNSPPYDLSPSLLERGTAFFFSRYVAVDNSCHQNYSFIYDIWKPPNPADEHVVDGVTASMTAVGLAGLSQLTNDRDSMLQARQCYGTALKLTNAALADPAEAVKDTTMLAVLILGSYEFLAGHSPQTMRAWQDHVNGAAALASLRGTAQFQSKAGIRMFLMLSHSVLISCIQSGLPMPQVIVDLRRQLQGLYQDDNPAWGVSDPIYRALQVRHDIKTGKLSNVDEIIQSLSKIDDELAGILSGFPPSWHYRQVQLTKPDPRVLGHCCHVYPGLLQVTTWNGVRAVRMLVLETILEQLSSRPKAIDPCALPHHQEQLSKTARLLQMLGEAIVASVPQHFGIVSFRDGSSPTAEGATVSLSAQHQSYRAPSPGTAKASPVDEKPRHLSEFRTPTLLDPAQSGAKGNSAECFMTLASASHTIIWPLYILGLSSSCSAEIKDYAIDRLHAIHKETGLEQARVVGGMLEARKALGPQGSVPYDKLPQQAASLFSVTV